MPAETPTPSARGWRLPSSDVSLPEVHGSIEVPIGAGFWRKFFAFAGPGYLVAVGYMDPDFFVYYDECDFAKRLAEAGWYSLFVPGAEAIHHDQLSTDLAKGLPRIVEFHRNRDLYMRKHHGPAAALAVRLLTAWSYTLRAVAATALPDQPARVYWAHARQALLPGRGRSIKDLVAAATDRGGSAA